MQCFNCSKRYMDTFLKVARRRDSWMAVLWLPDHKTGDPKKVMCLRYFWVNLRQVAVIGEKQN